MNRRISATAATITSVMAGVVVWMVFAFIFAVRESGTITEVLSGRFEPWDHLTYYWLGLPILSIIVGLIGFLSPTPAWRWGVVPCITQWVIMAVQNPNENWNLRLMSLISFSPQILLFIVASTIGARLADRYADRSERPNQAL